MLKSTELIADDLQSQKEKCDKLEEMSEMMGSDIVIKDKKVKKAPGTTNNKPQSGYKQDRATC